MALRFCKGKYIINDVNNINYDFFNINDDGIIVLKDRGKISAYMDSSLKEYRTFVHKENVFETGLSLIKKTGLEYIPVIHNDEIVCFCYNDELLDDIVKKVKDLIIFAPKNLFSDYSNGIIYGYNELAFYLEMLFKKNNFPYKVVAGSLSKNDTLKENNKTINLYVEGHLGLAINNYSYWKVFHEWLYLSVKPLYDIYHKTSLFKYDLEEHIIEKIKKNEPFMMARVGNTELWIVKQFLLKRKNLIKNYDKFWLDFLFSTSGFFSKTNNLAEVDKFAAEHIKAIQNCDFNLCYGHEELAEGLKLALNYLQNNQVYNYSWDKLCTPFSNSWFKYLEGKTILLISPYSDSLNVQIKKLNKLYNGNKYPNFKVVTYQCFETQLGNGCGFDSFFDALNTMKQEIQLIEFDIAFICAGAYGYLLTSYIKEIGKSSVELCSYLPNWFGIKIKRYCSNVNVNKYWNENWIFPIEKPINDSKKIEDSCYWE